LQNDLPVPTDEQRAVEGFTQPPTAQQVDPAKMTDFAASRAAGRQETTASSSGVRPLLLCAPPTSNTCERPFSGCKLVLSPLRASTLPANFETIMFLRANRSL
ncbi:hypothetical protein L914_02181, partial [Phytophthora nicotianae]